MSISWERPVAPADSGFVVIFSDLFPGDPGFDDVPFEPVCLHCLIEQGGGQLARGLHLARAHGRVEAPRRPWRVESRPGDGLVRLLTTHAQEPSAELARRPDVVAPDGELLPADKTKKVAGPA